jgi:hypothetical protein
MTVEVISSVAVVDAYSDVDATVEDPVVLKSIANIFSPVVYGGFDVEVVVTVVFGGWILVAKVEDEILRGTVVIGLVVEEVGILVVAFCVVLIDKVDTTVVDACLVVASTLESFIFVNSGVSPIVAGGFDIEVSATVVLGGQLLVAKVEVGNDEISVVSLIVFAKK